MDRDDGFRAKLRDELNLRSIGVMLGCLIAQMGLAYGYLFPPLAQDILSDTGWTRAELSGARLPQIAAMAMASPFIGSWVVRIGGRKVITASVILLGFLFFFLFPRVENLAFYYGLMIATGIALAGIGDVTVGQVVSLWFNRSRGLLLGIVYAGSNLGGLLLVPWAVRISSESGWRDALSTLGLAGLLIMLPAVLLLVRSRKQDGATAASATPSGSSRMESDRDLTLAAALRTRSFWILAFSLFAFFFYFLALLEHMVLYLTDMGLERDDAVARYTLAIALGIWSKLGLGFVTDWISDRYSILIDYTLLALSSVLLLLAPGSGVIWVFVISFGFSYAARDVVYPLVVTYCFGLRYMAPIYGALMLSLLLGAVGPFFAAWVHDAQGSYDLAFRIFALMNVLCLGSLFFLRDEREPIN